jgi:uncharacterized protein YfaT (DUF1175 family)
VASGRERRQAGLDFSEARIIVAAGNASIIGVPAFAHQQGKRFRFWRLRLVQQTLQEGEAVRQCVHFGEPRLS